LAGGGSRLEILEQMIENAEERRDGGPETPQHLARLGDLVVPGACPGCHCAAAVQRRQSVCRQAHDTLDLWARHVICRAGLRDQALESLLLLHSALDENLDVGKKSERLGDTDGATTGKRRVPDGAPAVPRCPALVTVI